MLWAFTCYMKENPQIMKIAFLGDIALVGQYNEKTDFDVSKSIDYLKKKANY